MESGVNLLEAKFCCAGGYFSFDREVIDFIWNLARTYLRRPIVATFYHPRGTFGGRPIAARSAGRQDVVPSNWVGALQKINLRILISDKKGET